MTQQEAISTILNISDVMDDRIRMLLVEACEVLQAELDRTAPELLEAAKNLLAEYREERFAYLGEGFDLLEEAIAKAELRPTVERVVR